MATPNLFQPSTWRILGLSVATGYTGLGLLDMFAPAYAAAQLGLWPKRVDTSSEAKDLIRTSTILLGARDLSIGIALFAFDYHRSPKSMGVLILSGLVLCYVDVVWVWMARGKAWGSAFAAGATIWGWIGLNLTEL